MVFKLTYGGYNDGASLILHHQSKTLEGFKQDCNHLIKMYLKYGMEVQHSNGVFTQRFDGDLYDFIDYIRLNIGSFGYSEFEPEVYDITCDIYNCNSNEISSAFDNDIDLTNKIIKIVNDNLEMTD